MTRVCILGASGRMGQALIRCSEQFDNVTISSTAEMAGSPSIGEDSGRIAGIGDNGVLITDDTVAAIAAADVCIDFTFHSAVPANIAAAHAGETAYVLGTTGLEQEEQEAVEAASRTIGVVAAPNMSLGVNLLCGMVRQAAAMLDESYDIEVVEMHHRHKKDAPSGTALRLAEMAAEGRARILDAVVKHGREGITGERPAGEIGMHSLRGGDVVGDHTVVFATDGERIELTHKASSRDAFANGALKAAIWVAAREPGMYGMDDVLGLN